MSLIENFLKSGHPFSIDENLEVFRFSFLNSVLLIAAISTLINLIASSLGYIPTGSTFEIMMLIYILICISSIFLLRKNKKSYIFIVNIIISSSLLIINYALFTESNDEFRLAWFFIILFGGFIFAGKVYGLFLMASILLSISLVSYFYDTGYSRAAIFTFINTFLMFTALAYLFLGKVEKDAKELKSLNKQLADKATAEQHQREEQEQMLLSQCRMADMGSMLDSIAHQWRQPLMHINSILMNMDHALENGGNKEYLDTKINDISSLTLHMSQTIEDFRDLFRRQGVLTKFSINNAINNVLDLMKNSLNNVEVTHDNIADLAVVGHKGEFMQVIIILLSNSIEVLNSRSIKNKNIIIRCLIIKSRVSIEVEDNAGGILLNDPSKIFEPYFTTKNQLGGTGLGLYIAKIIVEKKMRGIITVSNTSNGAKFTITVS